MGKFLTVLWVVVLSQVAAHASTTRFDCQTTQLVDKGIVGISFYLTENRGAVGFVTADETDSPVKVYPPSSQISEINDDYSAIFMTDDQGQDIVRLSNDGDVCSYITIDLYKNAAYRTGYVRMEGTSACNTSTYVSPLSCKTTAIN
jgi:hypothetical protein